MLVAKDIEHACLDHKVASLDRGELQPARDEHAEYMAVGKQEHIILNVLEPLDQSITTIRHLIGSFPSGSRTGENRPRRILPADLLGRDPLLVSVIPLGEVIRDLRLVSVTGQLAGPHGPLPGTAEHELKVPSRELRLQRGGLSLALEREGNIAEGSVPTILAPFGFTVADENNLGAGSAHRNKSQK